MAIVNLGTAVLPSGDVSVKDEIAGAVILAGQAVYRDSADQRVKLASTSAAANAAIGIALNSAPTVGQPVRVAWEGTLTGTATIVVGDAYFVSDTAGSVGQMSDIGTADFVTFVGIAATATSIKVRPFVSGVQHA